MKYFSVSRRVQLRLIRAVSFFLFNAWYVSQRLYSIPWRLALLAQASGRFPQIEQTCLSSTCLLKRWLHHFLHEWKVVALYLYFVASCLFKMCFAWYWISGHDWSTFLLPYWPKIRIYLRKKKNLFKYSSVHLIYFKRNIITGTF